MEELELRRNKMGKLAIVRIRGLPKVKTTISDTLNFLGLKKKHACVVLDDSENLRNILKKVAGYVTWGEISEETEKLLDEKRGSTAKTFKTKKVYFLAPPIKGFEKGGIKKFFTVGGALGYREVKINDLLKRMV